MNALTAFILFIHRCCLALYPKVYRDEFGEEQRSLFRLLVDDARHRGFFALVIMFLRELWEMPGAILRMHLRSRREGSHPKPSWKALVAAILPFLLFGIGFLTLMVGGELLRGLPEQTRMSLSTLFLFIYLGCALILVAGFGVGLYREFPVWAFPYSGFVLLFTLYFSNVATPGLRLFGHIFTSNELWGWRAWIPLLLITLAVIILKRSLKPLWLPWMHIWKNWPNLSFALYGMMPIAIFLSYDEIDGFYLAPFLTASMIFLILGAALFLHARNRPTQIGALLFGMSVALLITMVGTSIYWSGRKLPYLEEPLPTEWNLTGWLIAWVAMSLALLLPILIEVLKQLFRKTQPRSAGPHFQGN